MPSPNNPRPAIVVTAFDRPHSLARLLGSLGAARCPDGTPLIISVDGGGPDDVVSLARDFTWDYGAKSVRNMDRHLGLREHVFAVGDLAAEHGAILHLEDDVFVSPGFYDFAVAALRQYADEPRLAGISLYAHTFNETARLPFAPIDDGSDIFFIQLMSWGHVWTARQWQAFRDWYARGKGCRGLDESRLPTDIARWPETSWKKQYISYMIENDLYCLCPRLGHVTNFVDPGVHNRAQFNFLQTELALVARPYALPAFAESRAIYDAWCEIAPALLAEALDPFVAGASVCIDLYGRKDPGAVSAPYMLTTQPCREAVTRFGLRLRPREMNVLRGIDGDEIALAPTEAVRQVRRRALPYHEYSYGYDNLTGRDLAASLMAKLVRRIGRPFRRLDPE